MSNNTPQEILELVEFMQHDYLSDEFTLTNYDMFDAADYNYVAYIHGLYKNKESIKNFLQKRYLYDHTATCIGAIQQQRKNNKTNAVDHKTWIDAVKRDYQ